MDELSFSYVPKCSAEGCDQRAIYKIAAPWSFGASRELKHYGLCCEEHRGLVLSLAAERAARMEPAEGEVVGKVAAYHLLPGVRDAALSEVD